MSGKRTAGLITAICFMVNSLFAIPSFAADESIKLRADALNNSVITTDTAIVITLPAGTPGTAGTAPNTTGTAFGITGAAIGTSGTAISITGAAISTTGTAVIATGAAIGTSGTVITTAGSLSTTPGAIEPAKEDESLWYLPQIPMKKEHQKLLWDYCKKRGIDYIDMLALIAVESNFYEKCSSGKYKGYFQISTTHNKNLAATLKTANKPLDGAVNINWGTAIYSWILADKRVKGLKDKKLRDAALSIYQRGTGGYDRYGINKKYLVIYYKKRDIIVSYFKNRVKEKDRSE